jgi:hypothetical protein
MANVIQQRFQLLRPLRNPSNQRHRPQHNRHLPHALHLARLAGPGLGVLQVATSRRFRAFSLGNGAFQRDRQPAYCRVAEEESQEEALSGKKKIKSGVAGLGRQSFQYMFWVIQWCIGEEEALFGIEYPGYAVSGSIFRTRGVGIAYMLYI